MNPVPPKGLGNTAKMSIDDKEFPDVHDAAIGHNDDVVDEKRGNAADMYRMGKVQEMRVCASNC